MMKLLTKALLKKLPGLKQSKGGADAIVYVKLFTPWSYWTWYITEYDPESEDCFGRVDGSESELGYFSLKELREIRGPFGLQVERDLHWEPTPLSKIERMF